LEALRHAGILERAADGVWHVPKDFARSAVDYDVARTGRIDVQVQSWLPLTQQTRHAGLTWLDTDAGNKPGDQLVAARQARLAFLEERGWLEDEVVETDQTLRKRLRVVEWQRTVSMLFASTGRSGVDLFPGDSFEGRFEKAIDLGQGRFAVVGNAKEFALVPWRVEMERHRGREMTFKRTAAGVSWTIGIERGIER